jgi:hypothetical protein
VNILNDSICTLEYKNGGLNGFVPFLAKYVFLTSTKPPEEAYNFGRGNEEDDSNKRSYEQFERRLDYIIEFKGNWKRRTTEIIFHKGDEEKFRNMEWIIEYTDEEHEVDEIEKKGEIFTKDVEGEHFDEDGIVYWLRKFPEYKKMYLKDYPKCKKMREYKKGLKRNVEIINEGISKRIRLNEDNGENSNYNNNEILIDDAESNSSVEIDDSDYEIDV